MEFFELEIFKVIFGVVSCTRLAIFPNLFSLTISKI